MAELDWRSVAAALAGFVGLVALTGLARSAPRTITSVIVGSLLALALNPLVTMVQRRLGGRRALAVSAVLAGITVAFATIALLLGPPAVRQADRLRDEAPKAVQRLGDLPVVGKSLVKAGAPEKVQRWIEELPDRLSRNADRVVKTGQAVVGGMVAAIITLLVAVALLLDGERLVDRAGRFLPDSRREQARRMARLAYDVVGHYIAGSLLVAAIAGLAILTVGLIVHVPLTPLLAIWVAMFDLVPQIGGAVGGIPFVALAFTRSPTAGVICVVFFVLYLQFENHLLQPVIVGKAVHLSPPTTMIAALVGASAMGVVGALVAVPLVGAAKAVYLELRPEPTPEPQPSSVSSP